jgi:excinuclease ABC subunit C
MALVIKEIKKIPETYGVYFFRDKSGKILYIGKAANLKNRLKSYFDKSPSNPRLKKMVEVAKRIDYQETNSEIEALILESHLIKKYRPPFNVMLRDDKQYFFVEFTKDIFPKVTITHRPTGFIQPKSKKPLPTIPESKLNFIGPFTDGTALKTALKLLRQIFPYCTCKQKHNNYCLNYHIGNCLGFCCLKESKVKNKEEKIEEYIRNIKAIKEVLKGKRVSLIKRLERELKILAKEEKFEQAIKLRDKIGSLKRIFENARTITALKNLEILENQSNGKEKTLKKLKQSLGLKELPHRIEGYDVSNIHGKFATGAMIVFTDGKPDKSEYRKFRIKTAGGDTDMLSEILTRRFGHSEWQYPDLILIDGGRAQLNTAYSVISNLFRSQNNQKPLVEAGQFPASKKVLIPRYKSRVPIPIIALTKNVKHKGDYILTSNNKSALPLNKLPTEVKNLILQIDAEAHRFAIRYFRKLHRMALN